MFLVRSGAAGATAFDFDREYLTADELVDTSADMPAGSQWAYVIFEKAVTAPAKVRAAPARCFPMLLSMSRDAQPRPSVRKCGPLLTTTGAETQDMFGQLRRKR